MVVKDAFAEAADSLHELLGLKVSVRSFEGMNRRVAADVEAFREQQAAPADDDEGELLVVLSDATGVPLQHRGGPMQMAYLGASYTVDRFCRSEDQVIDEVLRKACAKERPQNKRLYGDMTRALPDDPDTECDDRVGVFSWLAHEVETRGGKGSRPVICLMDGEHKCGTATATAARGRGRGARSVARDGSPVGRRGGDQTASREFVSGSWWKAVSVA